MNVFSLFIDIFSNPVIFIFFAILGGWYLGRIQVYGISFDKCGVLIAAIFLGIIIHMCSQSDFINFDENFIEDMRFISSFGTSIFVSVIGISSGYTIIKNLNIKTAVSYFIGVAMMFSAFAVYIIIKTVDFGFDKSLLLGVFCGAITSTPSLASACELEGVKASSAVIGYSCSYIFGVIGTVLSVQIIGKGNITKQDTDMKNHIGSKQSANFYGLIQIGLTIIFGYIIGSLKTPYSNFTLGSSGGMLIIGIIIGCLTVHNKLFKPISDENLSLLRNFGLVLFLSGSGITSGVKILSIFDVKCLIYGIFITIIPLCAGYVLCRIILKKDIMEVLCLIAGGMTSTPAICILMQKKSINNELTVYSAAYIGAMITAVLGVRFIF